MKDFKPTYAMIIGFESKRKTHLTSRTKETEAFHGDCQDALWVPDTSMMHISPSFVSLKKDFDILQLAPTNRFEKEKGGRAGSAIAQCWTSRSLSWDMYHEKAESMGVAFCFFNDKKRKKKKKKKAVISGIN
ncbi:hypothetical protein OUZ56_008562 [Daphnia magna]|uniref:Uncharacterized protein n=1 Tax=Daphnia magna TaxID=35525 RepID=A0ABR0ADD7_9CRUS|nr:hypothetical protein OUZ56_008562 [Daphnia magna]